MNGLFSLFVFLTYFVVVLGVASRVMIDNYKLTGKFFVSFLWLLGVTVLPFPLLIIYILFRPRIFKTLPVFPQTCPFCNTEFLDQTDFCPKCGRYLDDKIVAQK